MPSTIPARLQEVTPAPLAHGERISAFEQWLRDEGQVVANEPETTDPRLDGLTEILGELDSSAGFDPTDIQWGFTIVTGP